KSRRFYCGGLLVFAQMISDNKKTPKSWKDVDFGVFVFEKKLHQLFTKPRGNARFFVENCRVLIGFKRVLRGFY
ncbi:hypothetical protein, partial [Neisseria sicca]|uniref:hypothetical protein n=1 Tax=Neisseria sicca TaxID=490 RepID=UPI001C3FAD12